MARRKYKKLFDFESDKSVISVMFCIEFAVYSVGLNNDDEQILSSKIENPVSNCFFVLVAKLTEEVKCNFTSNNF